jgi:chromosomal replication initiation ATPase DnaA
MTEERNRQLVLDLPVRMASGREDFLVTAANAAAVAMIDSFPDWPSHSMVLQGETGSGKSHLIEVWRQVSGARVIAAGKLGSVPIDQLFVNSTLAIDDAPGPSLDERVLFHILNLARQTKGYVLIASETDPATWPISLPDLTSRLKSLPVAKLLPPDDVLLRGVLIKQFADRQLAVDESVISYLMLRMPRSLKAARALVTDIDRLALETQSAVTKPLVGRVLQRHTEPKLFPDEDDQ